MRWAMENTTSMSCSVKSRVRPRSRAMRSISADGSRASRAADMPAVGSSSSRSSGSQASAMPSSSCFWSPWERKPAGLARPGRAGPTERQQRLRLLAVEALDAARTGSQPRPRWRQEGGLHVLVDGEPREDVGALERAAHAEPAEVVRREAGDVARRRSTTRPASGRRWPVIRLNSVVLPAPLGPMMARDRAALRHREAHAAHGLEAVEALADVAHLKHGSRRSPGSAARRSVLERAPAERRPGTTKSRTTRMMPRTSGQYSVYGDDLLVQPEISDERAERRAVERAHAAEQRHDQHLGRLGPVGEVGEDAAVEDAEQPAGEAGEGAGEDEGGQLVAPHVDADELGALGVLADRGQHAPERRADDAPQDPEAERHQDQGEEVEVLGGAPAAEERQRRSSQSKLG